MTDTVSHIINKLHLTTDEVYNIYCVGSRLWWPHLVTQETDYDYYIVVKGKDIKTNTHVSNIDAMIVSTDVYDRLLNEHNFLTVVTYFMDTDNKLLEKYKPRFKLDAKKLKSALLTETERDQVIAKKHLSKGNPVKTAKILNYCQIANTVGNNIINTKTLFNGSVLEKLSFDELTMEQLDAFFDVL